MDLIPNDLWKFGDELDRRCPPRLESHSLHELGLIPYQGSGYEITPAEVEVFATTGGDGTHFALMPIEQRPVLMIVPMNFTDPYAVVGESLHDFLRLGCRCGYFGLEGLVYDWDETIEWMQSHDMREEYPALGMLAEHFNLTPHDDASMHLTTLERRYLPLVERPEDI
jgi:hypothetical protein